MEEESLLKFLTLFLFKVLDYVTLSQVLIVEHQCSTRQEYKYSTRVWI